MPEKSKTPIPPAVQSKMQQGQRQRYAIGTTPSAAPPRQQGKGRK